MHKPNLSSVADRYLQKLCVDIPDRQTGSSGNRKATDFFAERMASFGFGIEAPTFECIDWYENGAELHVAGISFQSFPSPYSLGCRVRARLAVVSSVDELIAADLANRILLMRGEITGEQLMPKNFPFYNPDEHQRIIALLEDKQPLAIITATARDAQMAGAVYPFPLIEDGDFDIPSVYMTTEEGSRLAQYAGQAVTLTSRAKRVAATGCNVIARKSPEALERIVCFAHIDAKRGTPGALDNASGVITLLLLGELLSDYDGALGLEIVALNGEDYYSNPGEQQYLAQNAERFAQISLGINVDGVGYHRGRIAYSTYGCPEAVSRLAEKSFTSYGELVQGEPWVQGDHFLFLMNQRPALAFTSEYATELMTEIIHTKKDRPALVDVNKLAQLGTALNDLLRRLSG